MSSLCDRKYKDEFPLNTINRIRNIFADLGILIIEAGWQNSAEGFYSVNLAIENTNIKSNGKGTSTEFALASAYAELIERIQNQAHFKLSIDLSVENLEYMGFFYAHDEKCFSIDDILNSDEDWIQTQFNLMESKVDKKYLLNKWIGISYEKTPCDFVAIPYVNIRNDKLSYIPIKMASKMYMSNGMCAGNTYHEAIVQGISEILERHVNKEIILKKITPPTIPIEYINKYPGIVEMIDRIKLGGNYDVVIKDCSLNQGYPVVGVIFINKDTQSYFIKFGSHPIFEIAVERTLTELLQGQNIKNMMGLRDFSYKPNIADEQDNLLNILVNGSGIYPSQLFSHNFSYEFKEFEDVNELSNKEMLYYLINFVENRGYDIFLRNVSYLGFPSFHIIIPGLSEIEEIDNIKAIEKYCDYNRIKGYIRNLEYLSEESINEIFDYFQDQNYSRDASIAQFLNINTKNILPWYYTKIDLFLGSLHYHRGNFNKAYEVFDSFINHLKFRSNSNKFELTFYRCIRDYIGTLIDGLDKGEGIASLKQFYPLNIIKGVLRDLGDKELIFNRYDNLKCWNCNQHQFKCHCMNPVTNRIYKSLKERDALSSIEQENLKDLLGL
ncbi:MAG: YcaO-like family protein [Maledivibacter sp.]|jgi:ribosomal protein S12 methylthiotransferase accessory factor|nr:YcaO-like family protein [Maledivibacter sp.]